MSARLPCGCLAETLPPLLCDRNGAWICLACTITRLRRVKREKLAQQRAVRP